MGLLFDIKRYAINDGPGIRITLFLKGCPMSCVWCHNPEGIGKKPVKLYTRKKCIGCQTCVHACPEGALELTRSGIVTDETKCKMCGTCVEVCPACALEISGREWTVNEAMREIEKETAVMDRSEGGVTFCGGEPLMQPDFLLELLTRCGQEDIHRAVDTKFYASEDVVPSRPEANGFRETPALLWCTQRTGLGESPVGSRFGCSLLDSYSTYRWSQC